MYLGVVDGKVLTAASVVVVALVVVAVVVVLIVVGGQVHTVFAAKIKQFIKRVCMKKVWRGLTKRNGSGEDWSRRKSCSWSWKIFGLKLWQDDSGHI